MEVVLVIILVIGLFLWARSRQAKKEENRDLRYFEHANSIDEGGTGPSGSTTYNIDFLTMLGKVSSYRIAIGMGVTEYAEAFHVRRVSSSEWESKLTKESYDREKGEVAAD
jgi:hypothetical protein